MANQLLSRLSFRPLLRWQSSTCKIILLAFLAGPFLGESLHAQTYNGSLTLSTQAAVNTFNYTEIMGDLTIRSGSSITDLSPLSKLTNVYGSLSVISNDSLMSLTGLDNLTTVGYFDIGYNNSLKSLTGLTHLASVRGDFGLSNNNLLMSLAGLENLNSVGGYFTISSNNSLTSLTGLENLSSVLVLDVNNNSSLTSLAALNHLTRVRGYLDISNNNLLTSLTGLEHLDLTSAGSLGISSNNSLTSLAALSNLTSIGGALTIFNNNSLASLTGLEHITSVGGNLIAVGKYLTISSNSSLKSIAALNHLTSVGGNLSIQRNPQLSVCCILPSLTPYVKGAVIISDNAPGCNNLADITTACTDPATLSVSYADGSSQQLTGNTLHPYLQLNNDGTSPVAYKNISIRYWLTVENFSSLNTAINWAQLGINKVTSRYVPLGQPYAGAYGYIEYTFSADADSLASMSNSGPILSQISKADWTDFYQADDYSYASSGDYNKNSHITAYYNGMLVWGTEPAPVAPVQSLKAYSATRNIATTTSSISSILQLNNQGNTAVSYKDIILRYWFTADGSQPLLYQLDYAKMGSLGVTSKFVPLTYPLPTADTYLEVGFAGADSLYPASSTDNLLQSIRKSDWSLFNQLNDYSYISASTLSENMHITIYLKGGLVYGTEPTASSVLASGTASASVAAEQQGGGLRVEVLGNPVSGNTVEIAVKGVQGKRLMLTLMDALGRIVSEQQVGHAGAEQRVSLPLGHSASQILYVRVSTDKEVKTVSVIKAK